MRAGRLAPARRQLAAVVCAAAALASGAVARAAPEAAQAPRCVRLRLVGADAEARALLVRLGDILTEDFPGADLAMAPPAAEGQLFRADDPDAACLTAWVVVEPSRALVRAAGAGRCRFVFREVGVEHPLSELDRERVSQVAKAALSAIDDSPEPLGCAPPSVVVAPLSPPPVALASAPPRAAAPAETPTAIETPASPPSWSSLAIGATYGGAYHLGGVWQGPGLVLAISEPTWRFDPEVWVDLRYLFPHTFTGAGDTMQTIEGRVGVSVRWWPAVRFGIGAGADREREAFYSPGPTGQSSPSRYTTWDPGARLFSRISTPSWKGFSLSETLFLDAIHAPDPQNTFRVGVTVEVWWRS